MIFNIDSITELTSLQVQSAPKVTNGFIVHSPVEFAVFALSWRDAVKQFLYACCYGEKNGIAILTIEEQQLLFKSLSKERKSA